MKLLIDKILAALALLCLLGSANAQAQNSNNLWWEPADKLTKLWERLSPSRTTDAPVRLLHLGDSHLSGGYCTAPIVSALRDRYGDHQIVVSRIGVPGATYATFSTEKYMSQIAREHPDVILISLGTNDSYSFKFDPQAMRDNMDTFFSMLRTSVGNIPMILTTPPPSYLRRSYKAGMRTVKRGRRGTRRVPVYKTSHSFNTFTLSAANLLMDYARSEGMAYFDLRSTIGGEQETSNWLSKGLMHTDRVHYTREGYACMGRSIGNALVESIEGTISKTSKERKTK